MFGNKWPANDEAFWFIASARLHHGYNTADSDYNAICLSDLFTGPSQYSPHAWWVPKKNIQYTGSGIMTRHLAKIWWHDRWRFQSAPEWLRMYLTASIDSHNLCGPRSRFDTKDYGRPAHRSIEKEELCELWKHVELLIHC